MNKRKLTVAATTAAILAIGIISVPTTANAAEKATGAISCNGNGALKEIHTISSSKGNVTHQIYGATGMSSSIKHTSSITAGYSAAYATWNTHHWLEWRADGGKVFASAISSARTQCE
jgi:hypothetical protein